MSFTNSMMLKTVLLLLELSVVTLVLNILAVNTSDGEVEDSLEEGLEIEEVTSDHQETSDENRMKLVQLDPVKVGFVRQMELEPGKFFNVETVAMKPPIFLIHNFLSSEECEEIKNCALRKDFSASYTVFRRTFDGSIDKVVDSYYNSDTFIKFDKDGNEFLDVTEAVNALGIIRGVTSLPRDVFQYILEKFIDVNSDGHINDLEFRDIPSCVNSIKEWINKYEQNKTDQKDITEMKKGRDRISEQCWLEHFSYDPNGNIRNRLITLTGMHPDIIHSSENLQVVHYTPGGHYHAHFDSGSLDFKQPCAHTRSSGLYEADPAMHLRKDRACRFMTILYYLENTEEGGETAFPAADNETYYGVKYEKDNRKIDPMDLKNHCHDANLVVKPKKGLAVMWYNHYVDPENEWLGEKNLFSLHGGCDVIKGEKWIANNWITIDNNYEKQMEFQDMMLQKITESQKRDNVEKAPITEQNSDEEYLASADENFENEESKTTHFTSDEEDTAKQDNFRNEL